MVTILARELRLIHGLVGLTQQLLGIDVVRLRVEGDADTGGDLQHLLANRHRRRRRGQQAGEHRHAGLEVGQVEQHGDELVATDAGEGVAFAQDLLHAGGDGDQQLVARGMPVLVVDGLEAVQIEKGDRQQAPIPLRLGHALAQAVGQEDAIG